MKLDRIVTKDGQWFDIQHKMNVLDLLNMNRLALLHPSTEHVVWNLLSVNIKAWSRLTPLNKANILQLELPTVSEITFAIINRNPGIMEKKQ
jgi:hypothetical protein